MLASRSTRARSSSPDRPREQDGTELELRGRQPRPRPDRFVACQRERGVPLEVVPPLGRRRREREEVVGGAEDRGRHPHVDQAPRVGREEVVDLGGVVARADEIADARENRHRNVPVAVERQCVEALCHERLELGPRGVDVAQLVAEERQRGAPGGERGVLVDHRQDQRLEVRDAAPDAPDLELRDAVHLHRALDLGLLAERERGVGELLRGVEVGFQERERRTLSGDHPPEIRAPQFFRDRGRARDGGADLADLREVAEVEREPGERVELLRPVADLLGECQRLVGDDRSLLRVVRRPGTPTRGVQRVDEGLGVADPARHVDGVP